MHLKGYFIFSVYIISSLYLEIPFSYLVP